MRYASSYVNSVCKPSRQLGSCADKCENASAQSSFEKFHNVAYICDVVKDGNKASAVGFVIGEVSVTLGSYSQAAVYSQMTTPDYLIVKLTLGMPAQGG